MEKEILWDQLATHGSLRNQAVRLTWVFAAVAGWMAIELAASEQTWGLPLLGETYGET